MGQLRRMLRLTDLVSGDADTHDCNQCADHSNSGAGVNMHGYGRGGHSLATLGRNLVLCRVSYCGVFSQLVGSASTSQRQSLPRGGGCTSTPLESCSGPAAGCSAGTRSRNLPASLPPSGPVRRWSLW